MDTIKQSKTNIIKDITSHFGSEGQYYSFGDKGKYRVVNISSVEQYAHNNFVKVVSSEKYVFNAKLME